MGDTGDSMNLFDTFANGPQQRKERTGPTDRSASDSNVSVRASAQFRASLEERLSRMGASSRRPRLQRQQEVNEPGHCPSFRLPSETTEKGSLTPSMRKKYLKQLFLNNGLSSGFGSILQPSSDSGGRDQEESECYSTEETPVWALDPMEHEWILCAVDGNYDTIMQYLSEDLSLLSRRDFVSGFTAVHWLAKNGKHERLIKLLKYAEKRGSPVNVNTKGSGGLTPLHVAVMHSQYMVVKLLVGAFGAKIDAMDYSGRRAWQYLKGNAPAEMKELLGAWDDEHITLGQLNINNNSLVAEQSAKYDCPQTEEITEPTDTRRGRGRFGSLKRFLAPLVFFGHRD
ncbi:ankyrin repeat domain-containing protein SOWAHD [Denticeps clupeoides]|uniref:Uncharacterized protein n=1 Tax=Denticeps clupeoides TaxID=299321 RepID=A0AAY4CA17_9TELE|nr:ankyrin repeat domain-containing protein SOWAHD-like [Denticeps clupeoides]XP_028816452.1 ankyrin repeat domain-containing protein SOWAHD-like [Denticeps clupeoides]XP_028816453.1 ankyrin repeat domain-containing protein SOWAHD-like [Denticeps clupeoides]